jgi:thiol-disulfide isomerase/thioredoxin
MIEPVPAVINWSGSLYGSRRTPTPSIPKRVNAKKDRYNLFMQCRERLLEMNWKLILLTVVVVGLLGALYYGRTGSLQGFQNPNEPTFTMYYADWCGHCKRAKPEFQELVKQGGVKTPDGKRCNVRMVSPEKQPEEAKGKPIRGFPTFLLELPDGQIHEYKGARSTPNYLEFINSMLGGKEGAPATGEPAE